jgi:hypothetical protein
VPVHVSIVPGTRALAEALAPLLREGDIAEGRALGLEPKAALVDSFAQSEDCWATLFDGEVAAMCGVVPHRQTALGDAGTGLVWMLSGRACNVHPKAFLRTSRAVVDVLLERYRLLSNVIDARYDGALRWARWLGCEVEAPRPFGPLGAPFCPFTLRRRAA